MARGYVYKRCPHGITGTPQRGSKPAVPACRVKHGSWYWRAEGPRDPSTGKRTQPSDGGYATRDEAQEHLNRYLAETGGGRGVHDRRLTVGQWLRQWLAAGLAAGNWEPGTVDRYSQHVEVFCDLIGDIRLRDLRRHHVEVAMGILAAPVPRVPGQRFHGSRKASSLDMMRRTLRSALSAAVRRDLISSNPAVGHLDAIGRIGQPEAAWWQPDELARFLDFVAKDDLSSLWTVAALAGLRRSELAGLRWVDLDLDGTPPGLTVAQRVVSTRRDMPCPVCRQVHPGRVIRPRAKTDAGLRWVPLAGPAVVVLRGHAAAAAAHRQAWPDVYDDHGLVWALPTGEPISPIFLTKRHGALVKSAGLPAITLHDMRHGAVSILAASGMPLHLIAIIIGHASDAVTRRVYLHGLKQSLAEHMQAGADLVWPKGAQIAHRRQNDDQADAV